MIVAPRLCHSRRSFASRTTSQLARVLQSRPYIVWLRVGGGWSTPLRSDCSALQVHKAMRLTLLFVALAAVQVQARDYHYQDYKRWCILGIGTTCSKTTSPPVLAASSTPAVVPSSSAAPPPASSAQPTIVTSDSATSVPASAQPSTSVDSATSSAAPSSDVPSAVIEPTSETPTSVLAPSSTITPSSPPANTSVALNATNPAVNATPTITGLISEPIEATMAPVTTYAGGKVMDIPLPTPVGEAGKPAWGSFFSYSQPPIPDVTVSADPAVFTAAGPDFIAQAPTTRKYTLNLGYSAGRPDGFLRSMMTINNQFPGPLIEANKGDFLEITVNNGLSIPQSIHWHGIRQAGTNAQDGVPGISQCPIKPGGSYTYKFQVPVETGTFWYHSHYGNTMADGLVGGFLVHSKDDPLKRGVDFTDDRVLYLSDWEADQSQVIEAGLHNLFKGYRGLPLVVAPESILINGLGQTDCSHRQIGTRCFFMPKQQIFASQGSQVRFRLINTGSHAMIRFSIDGHKLKVIEVDDTPVEGVWVNEVPINTAQRYSVVVSMDQGAVGSSFWIRANAATFCVNPLQKVTATGILRYTDADGNGAGTDEPTSQPWNNLANPQFSPCVDLDESVKLVPRTIEPVSTSVGDTGYMNNLFGVFVDRVEHTPYIGFGIVSDPPDSIDDRMASPSPTTSTTPSFPSCKQASASMAST